MTWLKEEGFGLLHGIARFWASKAVRNDDGSYSIPQTGTPDEYHNNVRQKRCRCARVTRHRTISR